MTIIKNRIKAAPHAMGPININRIMPKKEITPVGSFVFLDYIDQKLTPEQLPKPNGTLAHPHRGIATLTYLMNGEVTHLDSFKQQGTVSSGCVQWMKSGNGIVHDEWAKPINNQLTALQFWINLSAQSKSESPDYLAVHDKKLPRFSLSEKGSYLKVIVGEYKGVISPLPTDSQQLLLHINLQAGERLTLNLNAEYEYAAFAANGTVEISGAKLEAKEQGFIKLNTEQINVMTKENIDLFIYGGEKYTDSIVASGPFVMNTQAEITTAYQDYHQGRYGEINYQKLN